MKNYYLLFISFCLSLLSFSQNFKVLEMDTNGDNKFGTQDLESLSYAIDEANDSLWFLISYYDNIEGDFGMAMAFDTNQNTTDGDSWIGTNASMKYDFIVFFSRNGFLEKNINSASPEVQSITETDTNELQINFRYSDLFKNKELNFLVGQGAFDITASKSVFDEMPDNTFMMLPNDTVSVGLLEREYRELKIAPNPSNGIIKLDMPAITADSKINVIVYNLLGEICHQELSTTGIINLSGIKPGSYVVLAGNESRRYAKSLLQIIE